MAIANSVIGSLFGGLNVPVGQDQAEQIRQAYQPVSDGMGMFLGQIRGTGAELQQNIGKAFGQESAQDQQKRKLQAIVQSAQQEADLGTPEGLTKLAEKMNQFPEFSGIALALRQQAAQQAQEGQLKQAQTAKALAEADKAMREQKTKPQVLPPGAVLVDENGKVIARGEPRKEDKAKPSIGQQRLDTAFAKEYSDYVAGGGYSQIEKILSDLDEVEKLLSSNQNITGIKVAAADKTGTLSALFPAAAKAKDLAGGVVQSNLRQILGGQFAQKEGEALLARAYNPAQPQEDNLKRIRDLKKQVKTAALAKRRAVEYWENNEGTLAGFKGNITASETPAPAAAAAAPKAAQGGVPQGVDPKVWAVMTPEEKALWQ